MKDLFISTTTIFLIIMIFCSCKSDETTMYSVDNTLQSYLNSFISDAKSHGQSIDVENDGLILKFGKLDDNVAGITYYTNPIRIIIDSAYWNDVKTYDNYENLRKDVVYHEFGHGLLKRDHLNTYLDNSEWKSIMCGGTEVDDRSWNINFRSIREDYYLDELFDTSTSQPDWETKIMTAIDGLNDTTINYDTSSGSFFTSYWNNGILTYDNSNKSNGVILNFSSINNSNDFYMEAKIKMTGMNSTTHFGIVFGKENNETISFYHYLLADNEQHLFIGNSACYGWYAELIKNTLKIGDYNIFGIRRKDSYLYYYLNGYCIYYDKITSDYPGTLYGIDIPAGATLYMDYMKIYTNTTNALKCTNEASIKNEITIKPNKWKIR